MLKGWERLLPHLHAARRALRVAPKGRRTIAPGAALGTHGEVGRGRRRTIWSTYARVVLGAAREERASSGRAATLAAVARDVAGLVALEESLSV